MLCQKYKIVIKSSLNYNNLIEIALKFVPGDEIENMAPLVPVKFGA